MNVAGTRALLEPPAGFSTFVPGEPPPERSVLVPWGLTPPEFEPADVFAGDGVLVEPGLLVVLVDVVLVGVALVDVGVLVLLVLLVLVTLPVAAADEVAEEVVDRLEPPQAAINTTAARAPKILVKCPTPAA